MSVSGSNAARVASSSRSRSTDRNSMSRPLGSLGLRRETPTTSQPAERNLSIAATPSRPLAPVTSTLFGMTAIFFRAAIPFEVPDKAHNEIFNVSNEDVYRWRQLWNELAAFYDLPVAEPLAMSTVSEMSEKGPLWDSIVARYGVDATAYEQIAKRSFVDWMVNFSEETILRTINSRQAGFGDCIRPHEGVRREIP